MERGLAAYFFYMDFELSKVPAEFNFWPELSDKDHPERNSQENFNSQITEECNDPNMVEPISEGPYIDRAVKFINAMNDLLPILQELPQETEEEDIMFHFYEVGKKYYGEGKAQLRDFFKDIYIVFFGRANGGRLGLVCKLFGFEEFVFRMKRKMSSPFY